MGVVHEHFQDLGRTGCWSHSVTDEVLAVLAQIFAGARPVCIEEDAKHRLIALVLHNLLQSMLNQLLHGSSAVKTERYGVRLDCIA